MRPDDALWQSIRDEQDRARAGAGYLMRARKKRRERRPPRRGRGKTAGILASSAFAVACAAAVVLAIRARSPRDLGFSVGDAHDGGRVGAWIAAPSGNELPLEFSDGSRFALAPASRARVASTDAAGAHIVLEKGRAMASVVHRPASHWRVDVGPFEVAVVGTRFAVSWEPNEEVFQLQLEQGAVVVSGSFLRAPQRLMQGQTLRAYCKERREEIVEIGGEARLGEVAPSGAVAGAVEPRAAATAVAAESAPVAAVSKMGRAADDHGRKQPAEGRLLWQKLAAAGEFRRAIDLVEQSGFEAECGRASGEDLQLLGDAARLSGSLARARDAYAAARGKLAGGGRTAYSLGLLAFDHQRDFAEAARWFDVYLREQPAGSLRREALGRLMEAWQRAGEHDKAHAAAERYLRDYPSGTQAALARELANR